MERFNKMIAGHKLTGQTPKECQYFLGEEKKHCARRETTALVFSLLFVILFGFAFYSTYKVQQLESEIELLRRYVEGDALDLLKKLSDLHANEISEDEDQPENIIYKGKQEYFDNDYDFNYDDDDAENIPIQADYTDIGELLAGGNFTKEGPETQRVKRSIHHQETSEGVPILEQPYGKPQTHPKHPFNQYDAIKPAGGDGVHSPIPQWREGYQSAAWLRQPSTEPPEQLQLYGQYRRTTSGPVLARRSRVMHQEDKSKAFKRVIKKSELKALEEQRGGKTPEATIIRDDAFMQGHKRRKNLEHRRNRARVFPTIHFSGDTSRYVFGQHANYNGNGHLFHLDRKFVDWVPKGWVNRLHMDKHFTLEDGVLTIKEPGLYLVYVQIYYIDEHDSSGFVVYKNEEQILQCTTMTHSPEPMNKTNTCFTAGVDYFEENDEIVIRDMHLHYSVFQPGKSFFGAVKI